MHKVNLLLLRAGAFAPVLILSTVLAQAQTAPVLKTVVQFSGPNGTNPASEPVQLPNGNFLGVTLHDSYLKNAPDTIYELEKSGTVQNLYQLASDGSQGEVTVNYYYDNGIVQASDGNIYGLMAEGGSNVYGLIYRFALPSLTFTALHECGLADATPVGKMVEALDGNLYGVTRGGGVNGLGEVFRVGLNGAFQDIYDFSSTDGINGEPYSGLALHPNGLLYGIGGLSGTIYQVNPLSGAVTLLAAGPVLSVGPPVVGTDGGLYVLAPAQASCAGCSGAIVRYGTDGSGPAAIFNFPSSSVPTVGGALSLLSDGTFFGGLNPVFKVNPTTQSLALLKFPVPPSFQRILGNFVQGSSGGVFGAIPLVGITGSLIDLSPAPPKPAPSISGFFPASSTAGSTVTLIGNYFVGATGLSVNGQAATFTVEASGAVQFVVPAGATSGPIVVATPGGTAASSAVLNIQ